MGRQCSIISSAVLYVQLLSVPHWQTDTINWLLAQGDFFLLECPKKSIDPKYQENITELSGH